LCFLYSFPSSHIPGLVHFLPPRFVHSSSTSLLISPYVPSGQNLKFSFVTDHLPVF
jgi:hypothetical protein